MASHWRFPRFSRQGRALVSDGSVRGQRILLIKPQTYMNLSGNALGPLLPPGFDATTDLLVLVDDVALPLGTFRIRARGSAGGHNGLKSVEQALGTTEYARLRIGIGPKPPELDDRVDFVLGPWTDDELDALHDLIPRMIEATECWVTDGVETAMNRYNRRGMERD